MRVAMVKHPREYAWSSYHCHAEGRHDPLVTDHPIFRALGRDNAIRRAAYRALFKIQIDEEILSEVRDTLQKGWVLDGERFKAEIAALANRRTQRLPKGRPVPETRSRRPRNGSTML